MLEIYIHILGFVLFSAVCVGSLMFILYAFDAKKQLIAFSIIVGFIYSLGAHIFKFLQLDIVFLRIIAYYFLLIIVPYFAIKLFYDESWMRAGAMTLIWHITNLLLTFLVNHLFLFLYYL